MASIVGLLPLGGAQVKYRDDLSTGDAELLTGFGFRNAIANTATGDDVWPGTATTIPIPADAGEQMTVVSDSAADTLAGTGAQKVSIHYLDANGAVQTEIVNMNGTTPVNTVATNIRFVQEIHVEQAGTGLLAAGTIIIYKTGAATTIYNQIQTNTNQSLNIARMVPAGKVCLIWIFNASAGAAAGGKSADIRIRATSHEGVLISRLFHFIDNFLGFNTSTHRVYRTPRVIPAFAIIKCTSYAATGGADVQASWEGVLIDAPTL